MFFGWELGISDNFLINLRVSSFLISSYMHFQPVFLVLCSPPRWLVLQQPGRGRNAREENVLQHDYQ